MSEFNEDQRLGQSANRLRSGQKCFNRRGAMGGQGRNRAQSFGRCQYPNQQGGGNRQINQPPVNQGKLDTIIAKLDSLLTRSK